MKLAGSAGLALSQRWVCNGVVVLARRSKGPELARSLVVAALPRPHSSLVQWILEKGVRSVEKRTKECMWWNTFQDRGAEARFI